MPDRLTASSFERRLNRRDLLRLAGAAGIALATSLRVPGEPGRRLLAQGSGARVPTIPSWPTELRPLVPNVFAYTQATGPGVDNSSLSNAGVIVGPEGLLAIDTLGPPLHAKAFKAAAQGATSRTFVRVVNTHHHRDHTNGNCFFAPAEIVASAFTRQATIEQGIPAHPYDNRPQWQAGMHELRLAPATTTITEPTSYQFGELRVELIPNAPAHTWGDVMVYLPQHRLLFAGDIAFTYVTPPAHNGHITSWITAIDRIMRMDVDFIVPGHGPVGTKKELAETRAYLDMMATEMRKRHRLGMRPGQAAADIDLGRFAGWTNPERHAWNAVRLYAEFDGTLTPATDLAAQESAVKEFLVARTMRR